MKKHAFSLFFLLTTSFTLSGLQGNFYFLPIPLPYFWFVVLTYYSFNKNLGYIVVANLLHAAVITSFSSANIAALLLLMNFISLNFLFIRNRFNTEDWHLSLASAAGVLVFLVGNWSVYSLLGYFSSPPIFQWLGIALATLILAVPLLSFLSKIDGRFYVERVDTLQNLRI